jgi:hypothetical protein
MANCAYCNPTDQRDIVRGSVEFLTGWVESNTSIGNDLPVEVSLDRATWIGDPGLHRHWRILVGDDVPLPDNRFATVFVRVTDNPEQPMLMAGKLKVT